LTPADTASPASVLSAVTPRRLATSSAAIARERASGAILSVAVDQARALLAASGGRAFLVDAGVLNEVGSPSSGSAGNGELQRLRDLAVRDQRPCRVSGWMAAPVVDQDRTTLGLIEVWQPERSFGEEEEAAIELLALAAAAALENARLRESLSSDAPDLQTVANLLPACVAYIGRDFRYRAANRAYESWIGVDPQAMIGRTVAEVVGEETFEQRRDMMVRALGGETIRFDSPFRLVDGRVIDAATTYIPDLQQGSIQGIAAVVRDITEERAMSRALAEASERYRLLSESVPVMVWTARPNGTIDFVNDRWKNYFQLGLEDARTEHWVGRIHPDDLAGFRAAWGEAIASAQPLTAEYRLRRHDGQYRWHLGLAHPLFVDGELHAWVGSIVDVDEQKAKEDTLAFVVNLSETARSLGDAQQIMASLSRMLGERLNVTRCAYAELDENGDTLELRHDWAKDVPSVAGTYRLQDFGNAFGAELRAGSTVVVDDVLTSMAADPGLDAFSAMDVRALVCCPLVKNGRLVAVLGVQHREARSWTPPEVELVQMVADRCWSTIARARAERELARSNDRYRALAEVAASVVFAADSDGNLTNLPLLRGVDPHLASTALGSGWIEAVHPQDRPTAVAAWRKATQSGTMYETQFRLRMADGGYRWHMARGVPVQDAAGTVLEWIGACVDVHDRINTERTLRLLDEFTAATRDLAEPNEVISLAQRLLGQHLGATRVAYGEPSDDGKRFVGPPNFCVGCTDLSGRFPLSGVSSSTSVSLRQGVPLVINDVAAEMSAEAGRDAYLAVDIAAVACVPLLKDRRLVAMLGVQQSEPRRWTDDDIELTRSIAERCWSELERLRAVQAVQRSEHRLRRILDTATVGVVVNDVHGRFLYANEPFLRLLGYTTAELLRGELGWSRVQVPERKPQDDVALGQLRATGNCEPYETEFVTQDGRRIPVYVGAALVPDEDGDGLLGAAFVTDLSALKEAEIELLRLNEDLERRVRERTSELEAANAEMEGFNYTVAHDLRAPLRAILSTASIVLEETGDDLSLEHQALLVRQAENAKRLAQLIDDLLAYSRLARQTVARERIDLTAMMQLVSDSVCEEFECEVQISPGLVVTGDPGLLRLAVYNLIHNAAKFSPRGGAIRIGAESTPRGNAFFVRDSGIGFDMAHANKLFEPFERLVRHDEFPGTGIGLANVKRIVERHGGSIWAESALGQGATFWFTLGT